MKAAQIRQSFLDFFRGKGHAIVPSTSLLPTSPNLLFTNAGMNQFVPYFLGEGKAPWKRVANTQKCIRAGGKHNDLEDVGFDTYHHTFFEMLGNWSFGDYFKEEAIEWAWELLTGVWSLPKERIYATIYRPGPGEPAEFDWQAWELWANIFRREDLDPEVHIRAFGMKENFWMMGETGPCGPCSELHVDLTPLGDTAGALVNADDPRCIEIWNLVFIQYNAEADGAFRPLPATHVDTGLGFERVAGIYATTKNLTDYSRAPSNYDSDLFGDFFRFLTERSSHRYQHTVPGDRKAMSEIEMKDCAFRVLADHIRTLTCSIADGILPGNDGRNYVLRRILRRAILFSKRLDLPSRSFSDLVEPTVESLGDSFPELVEHRSMIERVISTEEEAFERTIERGLQILDRITAGGERRISGFDAFTLYDTYGFPIDLTQLIARERGMTIDIEGFESHMTEQRERARRAHKRMSITIAEEASTAASKTEFCGYRRENLANFSATVVAVVHKGDAAFLVFDTTPFYSEMGGQIGDTGTVSIAGREYRITDTIRDGEDRFLHKTDLPLVEDLSGKSAVLSVDLDRRLGIQRHHTATHVLHAALRQVLGSHLKQSGSLVSEGRLRFDFSHFEQPSRTQLQEIETWANLRIIENTSVDWYEVPFDEKPEEAIAFFGDKYGSVVRIVDIGGWSVELCGGTHVDATGEIGLLKVVHESAIAAGTRRIEAIVGESAYQFVRHNFEHFTSLARRLSCQTEEVEERVTNLLQTKSALERELQKLRQRNLSTQADELADSAVSNGDVQFVAAKVATENPGELRPLALQVADRLKAAVVVLGRTNGDKVTILALATPQAVAAGHQADQIIKSLADDLGGNGGGKPAFAMGGGDRPEKLQGVLKQFIDSV